MKLPFTAFCLAACLCACTQKPLATAESTKPAIYYQASKSDKQMTDDLNDCAYEAFKKSVEDENAKVSSDDVMKKCMRSMGYDISYN